jgi:hypothetical protein
VGGEGGHEEAEEVLTNDEELRAAGNGAAAGFAGGGACGGEERVWERGRVKASRRDPWGGFIEREEGERGDGRAIGHQCHGGRSSKHSRGRVLMEGKR